MKLKQLNKKESFIFFPFPSKIIYHFYYFLFPFSFFLYLFSCNHSTSPQTLTSSGTVTLADTTDYSGVEVMLFKPVEIDTALTNLNKQYPGVGIELTQRTEFYWREHEPAYQTTTDANGHWKINGVEAGTYHLVVNKEGYGWRVLYDTDARNETTITMKKALTWRGTYTEPVIVPPNRFVRVTGNTVFEQGLSVEPGSVIEFKNAAGTQTIKVTVNNQLLINGSEASPIYVLADDTLNHDSWNVEKATQAEIKGVVARGVENGFYFKQVPLLNIQKSRLGRMANGIAANECDSLIMKYNMFGPLKNTAVNTFNGLVAFFHNGIYACTQIGLDIKSAGNSQIEYNVFKQCDEYALAFNKEGYGYNYVSNIFLHYNDFFKNKNHLFIGFKISGEFHDNNFYDSKDDFIRARLRIRSDTLHFENNYWAQYNTIKIYDKIYDGNDSKDARYIGPIVKIDPVKRMTVTWK